MKFYLFFDLVRYIVRKQHQHCFKMKLNVQNQFSNRFYPATYTSISKSKYFSLGFFLFQDYLLPDVRDRQYLFTFHRRAKKVEWDVNKYNALRDGISKLELDLRRLRDPLRLRATSQDVKDGIGGILGNQLHIGNIKEMLKSKFSS